MLVCHSSDRRSAGDIGLALADQRAGRTLTDLERVFQRRGPKRVLRASTGFGLTPSRNQSGERDVSGGITKAGDVNLRRALCQAATVMMNRARSTWLRTWAAQHAAAVGSAPWWRLLGASE